VALYAAPAANSTAQPADRVGAANATGGRRGPVGGLASALSSRAPGRGGRGGGAAKQGGKAPAAAAGAAAPFQRVSPSRPYQPARATGVRAVVTQVRPPHRRQGGPRRARMAGLWGARAREGPARLGDGGALIPAPPPPATQGGPDATGEWKLILGPNGALPGAWPTRDEGWRATND
jgi:hypothetical protein